MVVPNCWMKKSARIVKKEPLGVCGPTIGAYHLKKTAGRSKCAERKPKRCAKKNRERAMILMILRD